MIPDPIKNVLLHSAYTHNQTVCASQLTKASQTVTDWTGITNQAESHGLGPLLYNHIQAGTIQPPAAIKRELQGLFLRHRHANQVRAKVLGQILAAYHTANIKVLVLKGAALAQLSYPHPGLRPMRDMDLLVAPHQVRQAQTILTELGFVAPLPADDTLPSKHLTSASLHTQGMQVSVEIHHNLFHDNYVTSLTTETLTSDPLLFSLPDGSIAYTLGYQDMLWHLCHHIANIAHPFRYIWLADITGFAETCADKIDWTFIKQHYPRILNILDLFHKVIPLSNTLQQTAGLQPSRPTQGLETQGLGLEFAGWPRYSLAQQKSKGHKRIISDTLFPPEWWLRLYYGTGSGAAHLWTRWGRHPWHIFGLVLQVLITDK